MFGWSSRTNILGGAGHCTTDVCNTQLISKVIQTAKFLFGDFLRINKLIYLIKQCQEKRKRLAQISTLKKILSFLILMQKCQQILKFKYSYLITRVIQLEKVLKNKQNLSKMFLFYFSFFHFHFSFLSFFKAIFRQQ